MPHGDGILLPAPHRPSIVDRRHARLAAGYQHFIMYCCASVFGDTVVATAVSSSGCPAGLVRFSRRSFSGMESLRRFRGCYTAFLSGAVLFRLRVFTFGEFASISLVFFSYFSVKTTTAGVALGAGCSRRRRSAPPRRQFWEQSWAGVRNLTVVGSSLWSLKRNDRSFPRKTRRRRRTPGTCFTLQTICKTATQHAQPQSTSVQR